MSENLPRRNFISKFTLALTTAMAASTEGFSNSFKKVYNLNTTGMNPILNIKPLGFQWDTLDPFLFCVHHEDKFPKGNDVMGPSQDHLKGRHMGDDFIIKDGEIIPIDIGTHDDVY